MVRGQVPQAPHHGVRAAGVLLPPLCSPLRRGGGEHCAGYLEADQRAEPGGERPPHARPRPTGAHQGRGPFHPPHAPSEGLAQVCYDCTPSEASGQAATSRRTFARFLAAGAGLTVLAACTPDAPGAAAPSSGTPSASPSLSPSPSASPIPTPEATTAAPPPPEPSATPSPSSALP